MRSFRVTIFCAVAIICSMLCVELSGKESFIVVQKSYHVNLGKIAEDGGLRSGVYTFKNESRKPIVITKSSVDCSCLKITTPPNPIPAGGTVSIKYTYNPKGYPGRLNRTALIYTDASDRAASIKISFTGEVEPSKNMKSRYPFSMGTVLMKQSGVSFSARGNRQVERIAAYNDSNKIIKLSGDSKSLPKGVTMSTVPARVSGKSEFDIVITYDPKVWKGDHRSFMLLVDGLTLAPSKRSINVRFK